MIEIESYEAQKERNRIDGMRALRYGSLINSIIALLFLLAVMLLPEGASRVLATVYIAFHLWSLVKMWHICNKEIPKKEKWEPRKTEPCTYDYVEDGQWRVGFREVE